MKLLFTIAGCLLAALASAGESVIQVSDAYVRATPPGRAVTAAFFDAHNSGKSDCLLVAAKTDIARATELHTHIHKDGVMRMRRLPEVELPAGKGVSFKPGGLHIMLFDVRPLEVDENVSITLQFANCQAKTITAQVRGRKQ